MQLSEYEGEQKGTRGSHPVKHQWIFSIKRISLESVVGILSFAEAVFAQRHV
jgi:hypothetical protein